MLVIVSYDVATSMEGGIKRLRQVAKICTNKGRRVQNSVFECILDSSQLEQMKHQLLEVINLQEDSLRIYLLGNHYQNKTIHYGQKGVLDISNPIIL